jgi:Spy/CpxP family protein refolding chaperone
MFNRFVVRNERKIKMAHMNRPWMRRTLFGLLGLGLAASLSACGHGPGANPEMGGMGGGMEGMGMMHHGHHGPASEADMQKHHEHMIERISKQLDLDAAQKANLVKLGEAMQAQRKAMGGQPGGMPSEMQALVAGSHFDTAKAQAMVNDHTEAMRKGSPQVIAAAATFFDSLKPEQQAKVREFMAHGGPRERHFWQQK